MKINRAIIMLKTISVGIAYLFLFSCGGRSVKSGMMVATEAPGNIKDQDYINGVSWRYLTGSRIIAFNPDKPESFKVLTKGFYSACFPEISFDGRFMLFTAQQKADDPWQIWEMELDNLNSRKIRSFSENCADPAYLPGGRLVFSKLTVNDTVRNANCLFTCNLDGSGLTQITFSPQTNFATSVLKDGRLLTLSRSLMPETGTPMLTVMRPDGTKANLFYEAGKNSSLFSKAKETGDGKIVFIETDKGNKQRKNVISISYNRPLHTRINISSGIDGEFYYVMPLNPDKYLVSFRRSDSENFALYVFDPNKKSLGQTIFSDSQYSILDVAEVKEYERPKKLPSEVDMQVKTGLLLCQNINVINPSLPVDPGHLSKAVKIEVLGVDTTYGIVQVEEDGSFSLKVMADTPFRIRTIDENGNVINGPCSWLWLRPNERRGCVGCHEDPELVPENRVSIAVTKAPVIIPVHITAIKEKIVELE
jgi:hypothetical protein